MVCYILTDPYEYFTGYQGLLEDGKAGQEGKRCLSPSECMGSSCEFGKCIQLAKERYSAGFSYSVQKECRLCTIVQLTALETQKYWAVYRRTG